MSSGAGQTSGSLLAVGCNLRKVCNRSLERLSAIAFSFEGKCCAEKEKLYTAAVQVNVRISFIIARHFERPLCKMHTVRC